jgi:cell division septation protein DedD
VRLPDAAGRLVAAAAFLLSAAPVAAQTATDSLVPRVQQLVNLGNRSGARALADSALVIRTAGTYAYAEGLYARALATADAASAERDYLRVGVEYPLSARAEAAMMMAGQLKMSRGDRRGARGLFERLALEFPSGGQAARAGYWAGRLALEDGDIAQGCQNLAVASERVATDDVEFRNQIEYLRSRCMMPAGTTPAAPPDSVVASEPNPEREGSIAQVAYSVQVAAYTRKRDADATLNRLKARGFPVRVVGTRAPYRVRVGRYATREEAEAARGRMQQAGVMGLVVEAEPDES